MRHAARHTHHQACVRKVLRQDGWFVAIVLTNPIGNAYASKSNTLNRGDMTVKTTHQFQTDKMDSVSLTGFLAKKKKK